MACLKSPRSYRYLYPSVCPSVARSVGRSVGRSILLSVCLVVDLCCLVCLVHRVDIQTGYHTESILCLPILFENSVVAVAQLVNKLTPDGQTVSQFTAKDVETFQGFSGYAAVSLRNARLFRMADLEHAKSESMLSLAHALASDALDEARVTKTVMEYARTLTQADRCSLYLVVDNGPERTLQVYLEDGHVMRTPIDAGIPGHVLATGEPVNVADAYLDSRFNKSIDCLTGYRTRSLLCMPGMCVRPPLVLRGSARGPAATLCHGSTLSKQPLRWLGSDTCGRARRMEHMCRERERERGRAHVQRGCTHRPRRRPQSVTMMVRPPTALALDPVSESAVWGTGGCLPRPHSVEEWSQGVR